MTKENEELRSPPSYIPANDGGVSIIAQTHLDAVEPDVGLGPVLASHVYKFGLCVCILGLA